MKKFFQLVTTDQRYLRNLDWGKPRRGHPEGTVRAHILELETNLACLSAELTEEQTWKLRILIHVHDSFKADACRGVSIDHPQSHASIAKSFLQGICDDQDLLKMVQYHDEPYALWRQTRHRGDCNRQRLAHLVNRISDWKLFVTFLAIDGVTPGKSAEPLFWTAENIAQRIRLREYMEKSN